MFLEIKDDTQKTIHFRLFSYIALTILSFTIEFYFELYNLSLLKLIMKVDAHLALLYVSCVRQPASDIGKPFGIKPQSHQHQKLRDKETIYIFTIDGYTV